LVNPQQLEGKWTEGKTWSGKWKNQFQKIMDMEIQGGALGRPTFGGMHIQ